MWRDAYRRLGQLAHGFLLSACFAAGIALTWGSIVFGWQLAAPHGCRLKASAARVRVTAARDAVTDYFADTRGCPRGLEELVAGGYLDEHDLKILGAPL